MLHESDDSNYTFNGTLKVLFFKTFSVLTSKVTWPSLLKLDEFFVSSSIFKLSCLPCELFSGLASVELLTVSVGLVSVELFRALVALLSKVLFFLGTSIHSVISTTASARSKVIIPLLLREKCKFALIGAEILRAAYL